MGLVTPLGIAYVDPDGNLWQLDDYTMQNGYACAGLAGIEGLPVSMQTVPMLDGTAIPNMYIPQPGTIALGVGVAYPADTDDQDDYYNLLDAIVRAFLTRRNEAPAPGYLRIQRPDGTTRQIAVYTTSGLNTPDVGVYSCLYSFTLQTPDPYWQDLTPQQMLFSISTAPGILPVLPVALGSATVIGAANVFNGGNALAYPLWTITGPGTPTIQNLTTGRKWSLNTAIPSGQVVQVNTQPGNQYAVNTTTSTNIWDNLTLSSLRDLWSLRAGMNSINISMAGSSAATSVGLTWVNRWNRA